MVFSAGQRKTNKDTKETQGCRVKYLCSHQAKFDSRYDSTFFLEVALSNVGMTASETPLSFKTLVLIAMQLKPVIEKQDGTRHPEKEGRACL